MNRFSTSLLGEAKTLLLATDGSIFSDGALQEAIFFGQACGARLIALYVVKIDVESLKSANAKVTRAQQEIGPYMEDIRKMARDSGVECETVVVGSSVPEHAIVEQAMMREADVIIMGRHGRAGRLYLMVGSMTSKVIGLGFPMVLMLPKDFTMTGSHVLVAVDDSPNSRLAVEEALSLGICCVTLERLTFVAVARRESGLPEAEKMVEDICARGREKWPRINFEAVAGVGHASNIIVRTAEERKVDMIMIGGMASGPLPKMFGGRVTKEVCGWAHCAVLVVTA
ncbi:MAG: universal stress protein [Desulfomicrobium apsheronum]|nr:universal stress protein [Desulfomicrobium apsheronum]